MPYKLMVEVSVCLRFFFTFRVKSWEIGDQCLQFLLYYSLKREFSVSKSKVDWLLPAYEQKQTFIQKGEKRWINFAIGFGLQQMELIVSGE